ncbi:MAG: hypothetical protein IT370_25490 [Deltaproteobacteria bacterium]|nr:hypothetical protein [Deltaproteobacteria bacterium]
MDTKQAHTPDMPKLDSVSISLNIYQGTVVMLSIFLGFVFAALVALLSSTGGAPRATVYLLLVALATLTTSLMFMHLTAHQVLKKYEIFMPDTKFRMAGGLLLSAGIIAMFLAIGVLLWARGMKVAGAALGLYGAGIMVFVAVMRPEVTAPSTKC